MDMVKLAGTYLRHFIGSAPSDESHHITVIIVLIGILNIKVLEPPR